MTMQSWDASPELTPEQRRMQDLDANLGAQGTVFGSIDGGFAKITRLPDGQCLLEYLKGLGKENLSVLTFIKLDQFGRITAWNGTLCEQSGDNVIGKNIRWIDVANPAIGADEFLVKFKSDKRKKPKGEKELN